jgi:hypothetical protein
VNKDVKKKKEKQRQIENNKDKRRGRPCWELW